MRVLEVAAPGGLDNLKVVEKPTPHPGPGEVVVRMHALSLNFRDSLMMRFRYSRDTPPAVTLFSDGCGIVEEVGAGVTRVKPGDRVASMFFQNWIGGRFSAEAHASALGAGGMAAGAELALLSADGVSKVPDFLTDQQVATLPCAALTAWRALFEDARLQPGQTVLLQGTGGVSVFGLQFAHAAGLETIVTSSSDAKLERARTLGATHTVNYNTTPDWDAEALRLTGGRGVDFVMEVGGEKTFPLSQKALAIGGHIAFVGGMSGYKQAFDLGKAINSNVRVQGVMVGSREMFEAMCRAIAFHQIQPVVDVAYPVAEARAAFEAMAAGSHFGKIVLDF